MILLRQIGGGDISQRNMWLINASLQLLEDHKNWVISTPMITPIACTTFLRLITDHTRQVFDDIREKEINFCIYLLRAKVFI
jgi:integrator complex subunit 3